MDSPLVNWNTDPDSLFTVSYAGLYLTLTIFLSSDWKMDLHELFIPDPGVLEIVVRGSIVYLVIFFILRSLLKREAGTLSIPDLLMMLLIADAAQNAMSNNYRSITAGLILVATIVFWNFTLDVLAAKFSFFNHLIHPRPLMLINNGIIHKTNLEKEMLTKEQLLAELRQQGVRSESEVESSYMESNGRISVIRKPHTPAAHFMNEHKVL